MTNKSPWRDPPLTNAPLDYTPTEPDPTPDRPTRMAGFAINVAFMIAGLIVGLLF